MTSFNYSVTDRKLLISVILWVCSWVTTFANTNKLSDSKIAKDVTYSLQREGREELKLETLLVLGIGGRFGADYKLDIFRELRKCAKNIYVCDLKNHELAKVLLADQLVDHFLPITSYEPSIAHKELKKSLRKLSSKVDAVVTYREEFLETRALIAADYGLPHPALEGIRNSQDKGTLRKLLQKANIASIRYQISKIPNLAKDASRLGFPFFIKPTKCIRSEWARWISKQEDLDQYTRGVKKYPTVCRKSFLLEEAILGHEVDVDLVMHEGKLLYAEVSDNFPVYRPYSLETGHLMPSILSEELKNTIAECAYKAAQVCGYDRGVLHVELMVKPDGKIVLIELNGRMGGMYIARWHEAIWGVDLIKAELAISSGIDPSPFLKKKEDQRALAQLCITTNQDEPLSVSGDIEIKSWTNFQEIQKNDNIYSLDQWIEFPYTRDIAINGHVNIGAITVEAKTPNLAFKKLVAASEMNTATILTNGGVVKSSTRILNSFCAKAPGINRFLIRQATNADRKSIATLLPFLTNRASQVPADWENLPELSDSTMILVVEDTMTPEKRIVGMLGAHMWNRMRRSNSKTSYLHDLVIHPAYRRLGLARMLMNQLLEVAYEHKIGKIDLACDERLVEMYTPLGFTPVGVHLVRYLEAIGKPSTPLSDKQVFDQKAIQSRGELMYGLDIVANGLMPHDSKIKLPKHFFLPAGLAPELLLDEFYAYGKACAVRYSLHGCRAFSYDRVRGENSSRGRKIDPSVLSKKQTLLQIKSFISKAPSQCSGLILQELIDQAGGCLFHAELSTKSIEVELLWEKSTGRAYSLTPTTEKQAPIIYEEINGIGESLDRKTACKKMTKRLKSIFHELYKRYGNVIWSIEGFWSPQDETLTFFQLRPTPQDCPIPSSRKIEDAVYATSFTWGDYEVGPFLLQELEANNADGIFIRKDRLREELEEEVKTSLNQGRATLLIDPFRGFRLSHEKWFLPPPHLRARFGFIYIPKEVIRKYSGKTVKILASGGKGYLIVLH